MDGLFTPHSWKICFSAEQNQNELNYCARIILLRHLSPRILVYNVEAIIAVVCAALTD